MELTATAKNALLAQLAARRAPDYDPERDITVEDMIVHITTPTVPGSRNIAVRILKQAVTAGELTKGEALRAGKVITVYRHAAPAPAP